MSAETWKTPLRPPPDYEREWRTYLACKAELLPDHAGEFALIGGETVIGVFGTRDEAMKAGYGRFGLGPFLVQQILAEDEVVIVPAYLVR